MTQIRWGVPTYSQRPRTPVTQVFAPLTGDDSPKPTGLERVREIGGSPTVHPSVVPTGIARTRAQGTPALSPQVLPTGQARSRAVGDITVTGTLALAPASITRTRALGAVTVSPQLLPASLTRTRALGENLSFAAIVVIPTAIRVKAHHPKQPRRVTYIVGGFEPADTNVSPASLERTRALGVTSLSPRPASITRTRALGTACIGVPGTISVSGLTSVPTGMPLLLGSSNRTRALGDAQVAAPLPASLVRTRVTFGPRVDSKLNIAAIVRTRALGTTSSIAGGAPTALEHPRALGTHTLNPSLLPASLVQVRFIGNSFIGEPGDSAGLELLLRGVG